VQRQLLALHHAHCLVTGTGWLGLSIFAFTEAGVGHSLIAGYEQPVFLGILLVGRPSRPTGTSPAAPTPFASSIKNRVRLGDRSAHSGAASVDVAHSRHGAS